MSSTAPRHRNRILWALSLFLCASYVLCFGQVASAQEPLQVMSTVQNPFTPNRTHFFRVNQGTGRIAFCAQGWLKTPGVGTSMDYYGSPGIPELDYVLYHGYDGVYVTSIEGLDAQRSEAATAAATWLAIGEQRPDILNHTDSNGETYHGNKAYQKRWEIITDQHVKEAARHLYDKGVAYKKAGGGGDEAGAAKLWINKTAGAMAKGEKASTCNYQDLVTVDKKTTVTFTKSSADASFTENNDTYSLAGAEYDIFKKSDNAKAGHIVTDRNGHASLSLEPNTAYYAVETKAPAGFVLNTAPVEFQTKTDPVSVSLADTPGKLRLTVAKKDSVTHGAAQPGASLEGAEYTVTSVSKPGWSKTGSTDENGTLAFDNVPLGTVHVQETKAPEGYRLDTTVHEYTVGADRVESAETVELVPVDDFKDVPISFDIEIAKFNDENDHAGSSVEKPAKGVSFNIISNSTKKTVGTITTNDQGFASTSGEWFGEGKGNEGTSGALPYDRGGYTVQEVASSVPDGFERVGDWTISADQQVDGARLQYIVNNSRLASRLQIVKKDSETQQTVPLAGFRFELYDKNGNKVTQESWYPAHQVLDSFTTDETGTVTLPEPLATGTYRIHEVAAPAPYILPAKDIEFNVTSHEGQIDPITVVTVSDSRAHGVAELQKLCSNKKEKLSGAEFDVVAAQDVTEPDGSLSARKGDVVAHVVTDENGRAVAKNLSLGTGTVSYEFVETKPPHGHILDAAPVPFTLTYTDPHAPTVHAHVEVTDKPTNVEVHKTEAGTGEDLEGVTYATWRADQEAHKDPQTGYGSVSVRMKKAEGRVELEQTDGTSQILVEAPAGVLVHISDQDGHEKDQTSPCSLKPGSYTVHVEAPSSDSIADKKFEVRAQHDYTISITEGLGGLGIHVKEEKAEGAKLTLTYDKKLDAYTSDVVAPGRWHVAVDEADAGAISVKPGETTYAESDGGHVTVVPFLLIPGANAVQATTDQAGHALLEHLDPGEWKLAEVKAPKGYIIDRTPIQYSINDLGEASGLASQPLEISNDFTKVDVSKRDITTEKEVEGAHLSITDDQGNVIDEWISQAAPHRVERISPGTYTLTETYAPRTHKKAQSVTFHVEASGEIQHVAIYDEPIRIDAQVDKRQEIVVPVSSGCVPNGDGKNQAGPTAANRGTYSYQVDFRNRSNTWTDEFSAEDDLDDIVNAGATVQKIITPVVVGDADGSFNVWYRTTTPSDSETSKDNATISDNHSNPWLDDSEVVEILGEDRRGCDYAGWHLWRGGLDCSVPAELDVSDLALGEGEKVVGIRLEYGSVTPDFTSRGGDWEREDRLDRHDDLKAVQKTHEGKAATSPLIVTAHVDESYKEGMRLTNRASVHAYRNGGGDDLEAHELDEVTQTPKNEVKPLPKTASSLVPSAAAVLALGIALAMAIRWHRG